MSADRIADPRNPQVGDVFQSRMQPTVLRIIFVGRTMAVALNSSGHEVSVNLQALTKNFVAAPKPVRRLVIEARDPVGNEDWVWVKPAGYPDERWAIIGDSEAAQ